MNRFLLPLVLGIAALAPLSQANASGPVGKRYGGFAPGKTFTFTVTERISSKTVGTKVIKKVPVPAGIPNYAKGKRVKFTIGAKGQLTATGMSIPFKSDGGTANVYATVPTATKPHANVGQVYKTTTNKPTAVSLEFVKVSLSGFTTTTNTVTYVLK